MSNRLERSLSQSSVNSQNSQDSGKEIVPIEIPHRLRSRSRSALPRSRATSGSAGTLLTSRPSVGHSYSNKPHGRASIVSKDPSLSSIESGSSSGPHKLKKEDSTLSELPNTPMNIHRKSVSETSDSRNSIAAVKIDLHREQHEDEHTEHNHPKGSIYDDDFVDDLLESSSQAVQAKVKKFLKRNDPQDDQRAAPSLKLKNILANLSRKDKDINLDGLHVEKDRHERNHSGVSHLLDGILTHSKHDDHDRQHEKKHSKMHSGLLDTILDTTKRIASLKSLEPSSLFGNVSEKQEKDVLEGKTPQATTEMDMVDFLASTSPIVVKPKTPSFKKSLPELQRQNGEEYDSQEFDIKQMASPPLSNRLGSLGGSQEVDGGKANLNASGSPMLKRLHEKMVSTTQKNEHVVEQSEHELSQALAVTKKGLYSKGGDCEIGKEMDMLVFLSSTSPSESLETASPLQKPDSSDNSPNFRSTLAKSPSRYELDTMELQEDGHRRGSSENHHEWHFPKFHFNKEGSDGGSIASSVNHSRNMSKRPRGISETFKLSYSDSMSRNNSDHSLFDKYGKADNVIGKGAQATVRVIHKKEKDSRWYAVKEFRKKRRDESEKDYIKRVIAEFCISSSLRHPNVVETLDLINEHGKWYEVMEYCPGGDLLAKLQNMGVSGLEEVYCYFKQIINGISYIHSAGVVHRHYNTNARDLKPENILLDAKHRFLKITDFGVSTVFKTVFEKQPHLIHGVCGSGPYIAPEEWKLENEYQPTKVDIWACGMILYVMMAKEMLWITAKASDTNYGKYLKKRETGFPPFEMLEDSNAKKMLYKLLNPDPSVRPEAESILEESWVKGLNMCHIPISTTNSADTVELHSEPSQHIHLTVPLLK